MELEYNKQERMSKRSLVVPCGEEWTRIDTDVRGLGVRRLGANRLGTRGFMEQAWAGRVQAANSCHFCTSFEERMGFAVASWSLVVDRWQSPSGMVSPKGTMCP